MTMFTVVTKKSVLRVRAKSVQALTRALRAAGVSWLGVHEDKKEGSR